MDFHDLAKNALGSVQMAFGESANYLKKGEVTPVAVRATFDEVFESVTPETTASVSSKQFTVLVSLSELPAGCPKKGDKITRVRDSKQFNVIESEPDGFGSSLLYLHAA